jgi:hypothetical protein
VRCGHEAFRALRAADIFIRWNWIKLKTLLRPELGRQHGEKT